MIALFLERFVHSKLQEWFVFPDKAPSFNKGTLKLQNIALKKTLSDNFHLPIAVEFSLVESLSIEIPENMEGSLKINIKGVHVCASSELKKGQQVENRLMLVNLFVHNIKRAISEKLKSSKESLGFSLLLDKILKILEVRNL